MAQGTARLTGLLMAASLGAMTVPDDASAQTQPAAAGSSEIAPIAAACVDPNISSQPRNIRRITSRNVAQIYSQCVEAEDFVTAMRLIIPTNGTFNIDYNERGWHVIDQLFAIYDGKREQQTELNARLVNGARNPETNRRWSSRERDQFRLELLQVDAWIRTVDRAVNMTEIKRWRNDNSPIVTAIDPIGGTQCQTEMRSAFNAQQSFTTCGVWRAPQLGPLQYNISRVHYQITSPAVAPAASAPTAP